MRNFNGWLVTLVTFFMLTGCEAPLQMDAVEQGLNTPIRRSDQFQMASANDSTIVVVGNQALVLTSTDQGGTWRRSQLAGWPELIDVTSCPNGYFAALAAEGEVWVSQDDGKEWVSHAIDSEEAPQAITCDSQDRIWVVGSFSSIFSSEDAGVSWDFTSLDEDTILTNIQFVDEQTAYISGEFGTLLKTSDGGLSWLRLPDLADNFYPQAMYFEDANAGWIVGLQGQILHTEDGGESWVMEQSGTLVPLFGIEAAGGELYAVGGEGTVLRQQGQQWTSLDHGKPVSGYLRALLPVDADTLLVAGQAGALHVLALGGS